MAISYVYFNRTGLLFYDQLKDLFSEIPHWGVNWLRPNDEYMREITKSSLVHIITCHLLGYEPLSELTIAFCQLHTGKPNSPFSAKHHPFQAQTTRSPHTIPVLGLILPFTAQSHPRFRYFWRVPHMCCLLQDTSAVVGTSQGMARSTKSNHEASPEMTMVYHKD